MDDCLLNKLKKQVGQVEGNVSFLFHGGVSPRAVLLSARSRLCAWSTYRRKGGFQSPSSAGKQQVRSFLPKRRRVPRGTSITQKVTVSSTREEEGLRLSIPDSPLKPAELGSVAVPIPNCDRYESINCLLFFYREQWFYLSHTCLCLSSIYSLNSASVDSLIIVRRVGNF